MVHAFAGAAPVTDPKTNADGSLVLDGDKKPTLQFVRAVKVTFSTTAPAAS